MYFRKPAIIPLLKKPLSLSEGLSVGSTMTNEARAPTETKNSLADRKLAIAAFSSHWSQTDLSIFVYS